MFFEYIVLFKFFIFCTILVLILFSLSFFVVYQEPDINKLSVYECGFNPFGDARTKFEIKFYLVGILFIIFDLEIAFLLPWVVIMFNASINGMLACYFFLIILTVGFLYELSKGVLDLE